MARLNVPVAELAADLHGLSPHQVGMHVLMLLAYGRQGPLQREDWPLGTSPVADLWKDTPKGLEPRRKVIRRLSKAQEERNRRAAERRWKSATPPDAYRDGGADAYRDTRADAYRDATTKEGTPILSPYRDADGMPIGTKGAPPSQPAEGEKVPPPGMPIGTPREGGTIGGKGGHTDANTGKATQDAEDGHGQAHAHEEATAEPWPTFTDFWELFDYKTDRAKALRAWRKLSQADREACMAYVPGYVERVAKDGSTIPSRRHPTTFLNNRSWENELPEVRPANGRHQAQASTAADLFAKARQHRTPTPDP